MAYVLFANYAQSTIADAGGIGSGDTELNVQSGDGSLFPSISGGNYFYCVLVDSSGNRECIKVTGRATDTFTIIRGQDGDTPRAFAQNDKIHLCITKGALEELRDVVSSILLDEDDMASDSNTNLCTQQSIKAYHDNNQGAHVDDSSGGPYINSTPFNVFGATEVTWESVGPTGGGADNLWTALDDVASDADWIEVRVGSYVTRESGSDGTAPVSLDVDVRKEGSAVSVGSATKICECAAYGTSSVYGYDSQKGTYKIPVNSRQFEVYWNEVGSPDNSGCTMYLVGYGYN